MGWRRHFDAKGHDIAAAAANCGSKVWNISLQEGRTAILCPKLMAENHVASETAVQ